MPDDTRPISGYKGILGQVNTPLVFFALALLVIEGIIGFTLVNSRLDAVQQFNVILIKAALFMAVILSCCVYYGEISPEFNG